MAAFIEIFKRKLNIDDKYLHDARVPELVKSRIKHCGEEISAAWTEGFIIQLHKDRRVINVDDHGVREFNIKHIARYQERTGGKEKHQVDGSHCQQISCLLSSD